MRIRAIILDNGDVRVISPADEDTRTSDERQGRHWSCTIGWIASPSVTRIECDPAALTVAAFARLCDWLSGLPPNRTVWLDYRDGGLPSYEIRFGAVASIEALKRRRSAYGRAAKPYLRHIVRATDIPDHAAGLRHMLAIWREKHDRLDRDIARDLAELNNMRLVVLRPTSGRGHVIKSSGDGYDSGMRRWLEANVGAPVGEWPDQSYGGACERAYQDVNARGTPVHDEIDSVTIWPGGRRERRTYRRLLLPFMTATGERNLVVATRLDPAINLRSGPHAHHTALA